MRKALLWGGSIVLAGGISLTGLVAAAGMLTLSSSTGLSNGQAISVSGSGLAASSIGTITECNSDANQPTVTVAGNAVPVSCSNPLSTLVTTDKNGNLPTTSFTVHTGTVGPAASGTDSSGKSAASDAANYPCPPTAAQLAAGDSCVITFGDAGGDDISQNITFVGQSSSKPKPTTPSPTSSSSTSSSESTTPNSSSSSNITTPTALTNTGPGNLVVLFIGTCLSAGLIHYIYYRFRSKSL